jgi:5-methylcytosine-specific restriction endonuclease McrA
MKRKSPPSKFKIAKYWLTNKNKVLSIADWLFIDLGEPTCWVCNDTWDGKFDFGEKKILLSKCWDNAPLERCHIVPRASGGSYECSNLFLMCGDCHRASPDTVNKEMFFKWCSRYRQSYIMGHQLSIIKRGIELSGLSDREAVGLLHQEIFPGELREELRRQKANTHGAILSEGTKEVVIAQTLLRINRRKNENFQAT